MVHQQTHPAWLAVLLLFLPARQPASFPAHLLQSARALPRSTQTASARPHAVPLVAQNSVQAPLHSAFHSASSPLVCDNSRFPVQADPETTAAPARSSRPPFYFPASPAAKHSPLLLPPAPSLFPSPVLQPSDTGTAHATLCLSQIRSAPATSLALLTASVPPARKSSPYGSLAPDPAPHPRWTRSVFQLHRLFCSLLLHFLYSSLVPA